MSRRKQSNPKPLKRKSEDVLEEVAELHHLPHHILALQDPEDESLEYTVFSKTSLREGFLFGPFNANLISDVEDVKHLPSHNVIQVKSAGGNDVIIQLLDDLGGWLKLIRPASSHEDANVSLTLDGSELWCTVKDRIEPHTELLMTCQILDYVTRPSSSSPHSYSSPRHINNNNNNINNHNQHHNEIFMEQQHHHRHRRGSSSSSDPRTAAYHTPEMYDGHLDREESAKMKDSPPSAMESGRLLFKKTEVPQKTEIRSNLAFKYEPSSPSSSPLSETLVENFHNSTNNSNSCLLPASTAAVSATTPPTTTTAPQINGFRYGSAFSYGSNSGNGTGFQCGACDIKFSSPRTLHIHQIYYCSQRISAAISDTDTEDANMNTKTDTVDNVRSTGSPSSDSEQVKQAKETNSSPKLPNDRDRDENNVNVDKQLPLVPNSSVIINSGNGNSMLKSPRIFRCPYCKYASDKKASVTRHIRMHGTSPNADASNEIPISIPPVARYCANCDIQFASYKNYQVHKQFYCSTRHVHKSTTSNTDSPQSSQSLVRTGSPPEKPSEMSSQEISTNSYGMMLNQPLYAAISTSPLILVPCSYVPGGGLTPTGGLIPSGSIIIPNTSATAAAAATTTTAAVSPGGDSSSDERNLVTNYMKAATVSERAESSPDNVEAASPEITQGKKTSQDNPGHKEIIPTISKEEAEKPLDLSFRKKCDPEVKMPNENVDPVKKSTDAVAARAMICEDSSSTSSVSKLNFADSPLPNVPIEVAAAAVGAKNLPLVPPVVPPGILLDPRNPCVAAAAVPPAPQVLVKQGTSKCKECNIVFYKHENYLVHKSMYCASRVQKLQPNSPQEVARPAADERTSDTEEAGPRGANSNSPVISHPVTPESVELPSGNISPKNQGTVLQYYCMACGIKFTSMDNLTAHQTYYCPKRENANVQPIAMVPTAIRGDFRCSKCKNSYPTEESLKSHPCALQRKCPYCDVYCPTLSAAQRHLVTHTGVKSFRCSLCGYKGHTLRGMRTHIRIHLDKNNTTPEEAYILCVDEGGAEIGSINRKNNRNSLTEKLSAFSSDSMHSESIPVNLVPPTMATTGIPSTEIVGPRKGLSDIVSDQVFSGEITHWCQICGYSSSYKGNVVRHVKLVHKELMATQSMTSIVNSKPSAVMAVHDNKPTIDTTEPIDVAKTKSAVADNADKPLVVNGTSNAIESSRKLKCEGPVPIKTESLSPPPVTSTDSRTLKRSLSVEGQSITSSSSSSSSSSSNALSATNTNKSGPKYCKSCDISFNYLSNFIAHKKFYCTPRPGDNNPAQETGSVQSVQ